MKTAEYTVDRKRWSRMSIYEQMGNIGSEVGRSINAKRQNNPQDCQAAVIRALDLFDATVDQLIKQKSPKVKEVLRSKDQFLAAIYEPEATLEDLNSIEGYFMQYAIAARLNR